MLRAGSVPSALLCARLRAKVLCDQAALELHHAAAQAPLEPTTKTRTICVAVEWVVRPEAPTAAAAVRLP